MFSKKATKIDKIFTVDLTVTTYCQIDGEVFPFFGGLLRKKWTLKTCMQYTHVFQFGHCATDFQSCYDFEVLFGEELTTRVTFSSFTCSHLHVFNQRVVKSTGVC